MEVECGVVEKEGIHRSKRAEGVKGGNSGEYDHDTLYIYIVKNRKVSQERGKEKQATILVHLNARNTLTTTIQLQEQDATAKRKNH